MRFFLAPLTENLAVMGFLIFYMPKNADLLSNSGFSTKTLKTRSPEANIQQTSEEAFFHVQALARLEAYVLGIDWRRNGVSLPVIKAALMGMPPEETARILGFELAAVEEMLHRANQQLLGRFSVALAHYFACDYTQALLTLDELGYSDSRVLPPEVFQRFKPRRGEFRLEDCEAELRFLATVSILRIEHNPETKPAKVAHLLAILQSGDSRDQAARQQIITAIEGIVYGQRDT